MTTYTLFAALLIGAPALKEKDPPKEPPPIGEWTAQRIEQNGKNLGLEMTMIFDSDTLTMRIGGMDHRVPVKFDSAAKVKEITLDHQPPRGPLRGIYKIEGDTLTICSTEVPDGPRPTEFTSKLPNTTLFVLKRAKK